MVLFCDMSWSNLVRIFGGSHQKYRSPPLPMTGTVQFFAGVLRRIFWMWLPGLPELAIVLTTKLGMQSNKPHTVTNIPRITLCSQRRIIWLAQVHWIRLADLAWTKTTPKCKLKYFVNWITLVDGVKTIWLPSTFPTLFMHVHIGISPPRCHLTFFS